MRKRKPKRKAAPRVNVKRDGALYKRFTGQEPVRTGTVQVRTLPPKAICIGYIDALDYTTMRFGKLQRFRHEFKKHARPLFAVSIDGRQLLLLGGAYRFTYRGIVDRSRKK